MGRRKIFKRGWGRGPEYRDILCMRIISKLTFLLFLVILPILKNTLSVQFQKTLYPLSYPFSISTYTLMNINTVKTCIKWRFKAPFRVGWALNFNWIIPLACASIITPLFNCELFISLYGWKKNYIYLLFIKLSVKIFFLPAIMGLKKSEKDLWKIFCESSINFQTKFIKKNLVGTLLLYQV